MSSPKIDPEVGCVVPERGQWPVDPQDDVAINEDRLWVDGCFDFFHHGHTGVLLQSRRLGSELVVGLHSDEEISANKGPTVMSLSERVAAVNACRFSTKSVPYAPYVTSLPWISHYGCQFVTHGDDVTSDATGEDCYRFVKRAGRMKIVPRTPGISTTDLVGRMLLCTKYHFIKSLPAALEGKDGDGSATERAARGQEMAKRIREYAAAPNGWDPHVTVWSYAPAAHGQSDGGAINGAEPASANFTVMVPGTRPRPGQRIVYVDGSFDLFSSGHIAFLKQITELEHDLGTQRGWSEDYPPAYVVAGVHDDAVVNRHKGINYPIMNIFERGLCVVQCRYVDAVVFGAPYTPAGSYLRNLPGGSPDVVYHGLTSFMPSTEGSDPYAEAKAMGVFRETPAHAFQDVSAAQIVQRILDRKVEYEERQRRKGMKGIDEGALRREELEREAEEERRRRQHEVEVRNGA